MVLVAPAWSQVHSRRENQRTYTPLQGEETKHGVAEEMVHVDKCVIFQNQELSVNTLAHRNFQKNILLLSGLTHLPLPRKTVM